MSAVAAHVSVDDRCTACGACLVTCPEQALVAAPRRPEAVAGRCTGCLACIEICPRDAITVEDRAAT
jgi:Pyruvate/2-oxoacid:ferredoxin oxidoreductase delta subunit